MTDTTDGLETRILAVYDSLTPKQQMLARFILDNRYFASFASASELGAKVDASAATVIRFCQTLGYDGLPGLQGAIRAELPSYLTAVERLEHRITALPASTDLPRHVFAIDVQNIQRTASAIDQAIFEAAIRRLAAAREIIVVATGVTAAAGFFLAYSLEVIGLRARAVLDGGVAQAVTLTHLGVEDVVVGLGVWRYVRSTLDALHQAKEQGATVIAITDSIVSPLARHADYAFEVATEGAMHSLSMTGVMSLINALVAATSLVDPARTSRALQRIDRQFVARELLIS
ncbi:MurR/RpiR family transcriptional regulator [Caldilinea sp.]|uniref:MurR/RpiR family transcriptional regulator n=1 Tax=Caldilinea sp. TaxID=2293560 RepID=UPI0021DF025F|nr:MurR/RpiR family transcriptional regulator [Caldilinea sp.]GIV72487.1 MAG: N-acetylmannosamine kinase [Caldilinea sp.]